jgi:hypothetical protein
MKLAHIKMDKTDLLKRQMLEMTKRITLMEKYFELYPGESDGQPVIWLPGLSFKSRSRHEN